MAPNSLFTTNCAMHSASTPTSAILTALGKRAASKTPTAGSDDFCRVEQICSSARRSRSTPSLDNATIPRANALASKLQLSYSTIICCTSNVNPPPSNHADDKIVTMLLKPQVLVVDARAARVNEAEAVCVRRDRIGVVDRVV